MVKVTAGSHADLDILLDQLVQALGEQLLSVVLYGSAARGDYEKATSDLNLMLVVAELTPAALERMSPALVRWESRGQPLPRLFTPTTIVESVDVFPVEFLDLRACRRVLVGCDPFETLEVKTVHLRLQCERELREKMMRLREGYVETHNSSRRLRRLLTDSYTTFVALFRGCLWLHGDEVPNNNEQVVERFCVLGGLNPAAFDAVARIKHGKNVVAEERSIFADYYAELTRAVTRIDRFDGAAGGERG